jgi:hypothetical protein
MKLASDLDLDNRVKCLLAGYVALDLETGAFMTCSYGRRKAGRASRYYLHIPGEERSRRIEAYSDEQALSKALELVQ